MAKSVLELGVNSGQWDAGLKKAQNALNNFVQSNGGLQNALTKDGQKIQTFVEMMGKMESTATTAKGKMNDYKRSIEVLTEQYKLLSAAQQKGVEGMTYMKSIDQITVKYRAAAAEVQKLNASLNVSNVAGSGGLGIGASIGSAFKMFGPAALAAGGVMAAMNGLKSAISDMVQINMQFEQSSANLAAVLGTTRDQTTALTAQAKQLGATTQYTAIQITDLQTNLARLGFTQQEILASTKAIQDFATATRADLGEAANVAGAALRGFGMNAAEMERVASVLAVSTTKSALSFEKLATALPIVAPVAKQFGFTIEDTVTLLGKLSDAGFDASTAATATRNIFLKMANESGKLAQALGRPVHNVEEFGEALKELREKGMSLNDILSMVGVRSTAAFAVFADNAGTLKDFKESITDCSDALQGMVDEQLNTLQGSVTILKSSYEGLILTFSNSNGILKKTTDALTRLLQAWTNWNNRRAGGDAAISSYEQGLTTETKGQMDMLYKSYKAGGTTDEQIKSKADSATESLIKERDAVRDLYDQIVALNKATGAEYMTKLPVLEAQAQAMFPDRKAYDNNYIAKYIAGLNDKIASQQYLAGLVTPEPDNEDPNADQKKEEAVKVLKARYEEEEKAQIAALDRKAMNEEEYEAKVYEIRRASMEKIAALYNEDTAEHARALARISQLEIEYQGKQMRFANRRDKGDDRTLASILGMPKMDTRATEGNISALRQKLQKELSSATIGSEGYLIAADSLVDLNSFSNLLKAAVDSGLDLNSYQLQETLSKIRLGVDIPEKEWLELENKINEKRAQLSLDPITLDVKTGGIKAVKSDVESMTQSWQIAAQAISQVGSAMQNIENPAAKIAGLIAGAIAQVAFAAGEAISAKDTTASGWAWIGAAAAITATMISTIVAIKQATAGSYEKGGIVPGNSFHGDHLTAAVNSGELILSRSQQDNIASQLQNGNPFANLRLTTEISGANLRVVLNNDNRSRGGERTFYSEIH